MTRRAAILFTIAVLGPGCALASGPISRPDYVAPACRAVDNAKACGVALRYLAALDLDRFDEVCALLEPETLEGAGGLARCKRTLRSARGLRIRYSLTKVVASALGHTVFFSTRRGRSGPLPQGMIVTPRGLILAVVPVPNGH